MGIYLNPGNDMFRQAIEKEIYVDKSLLIEKLWRHARKKNPCICISRPRRFGKSTDAHMLAAFFSRGCQSRKLFGSLKISEWDAYQEHLNQHDVLFLNIQDFLSRSSDVETMIRAINQKVIAELQREYPDCPADDDLSAVLEALNAYSSKRFIFIIDEWDCIFREFRGHADAQKKYLDYLRLLLKDHAYTEKDTFVDSIRVSNWDYAARVFQNSSDLLNATWLMQEKQVAEYIQNSHYETSILQYNDENALAYTVNLAYIMARQYYTIIREFPTGKGFADLVFIPKTDKPAMIVELKYDQIADSGIRQIKDKKYVFGLEKYLDNLLLVSVNYDKRTKEHTCIIEKYQMV